MTPLTFDVCTVMVIGNERFTSITPQKSGGFADLWWQTVLHFRYIANKTEQGKKFIHCSAVSGIWYIVIWCLSSYILCWKISFWRLQCELQMRKQTLRGRDKGIVINPETVLTPVIYCTTSKSIVRSMRQLHVHHFFKAGFWHYYYAMIY